MRTTVVFIHGLWLHASSWTPWLDMFCDAGYPAIAPGWPGLPRSVELARANPDSIADVSISAVAEHYAEIIAELPTEPVVIGHSVGGVIAQRLLAAGRCAAAIAIDAPLGSDALLPRRLAAVRAGGGGLADAYGTSTVTLTGEQFRSGFGNAISAEESAMLYGRWSIPGPGRPAMEVAETTFLAKPGSGGKPLLHVIAGPGKGTADRADLVSFPDRGHSLTIDSGWRAVAEQCLAWLARQGL
jgi:pimeloyl-ACP methyl ester carboxylesterase